jgi:hypothetical protein
MRIAAKINVQETARLFRDVVVVGAGPAGGFVARELALRKLTVLLIDRAAFPPLKVWLLFERPGTGCADGFGIRRFAHSLAGGFLGSICALHEGVGSRFPC